MSEGTCSDTSASTSESVSACGTPRALRHANAKAASPARKNAAATAASMAVFYGFPGNNPHQMEYVKLGRTGLDVSRLCLGCMTYGAPDRGRHAWTLPEHDARPLIRRAIEAGVN